MFAGFSEQEVSHLLHVAQLRESASGEMVFEQGANGDTLVVVLDGLLRVEVTDQTGTTATIATIQAGELVGEMAVLDPSPRSASVIAATDCQMMELSRDGLIALRTSCPSASSAIVGAVIGDVTRRLRNVNKRIDKELDPERKQKQRLVKTALGSKNQEKDDKGGFIGKLLRRFGR